ncbi:hypothetical protein BGZ72_001306 [Mortierella alpina]|nr:hypothetical protein BGZ72_001306 [Mortierella alpina]
MNELQAGAVQPSITPPSDPSLSSASVGSSLSPKPATPVSICKPLPVRIEDLYQVDPGSFCAGHTVTDDVKLGEDVGMEQGDIVMGIRMMTPQREHYYCDEPLCSACTKDLGCMDDINDKFRNSISNNNTSNDINKRGWNRILSVLFSPPPLLFVLLLQDMIPNLEL